MSAKTIASIVLAFIALAIGPITYVDHARQVNEYEKQTAFCTQWPSANPHPSCRFHDMKPAPSIDEWIGKWSSDAGPLLVIIALIYFMPIVWRFILDRLRELSRAIRGMD